jgi:outer membrane biosynthesis protein TonB
MHEGNEAITRFGQRRPASTARQPRSSVLSRPGPRHTPPPRPRVTPPQRARRPVDLDHMYGGYALSAAGHALVFLLIILGLPDLFRHKPPEPMPVAVQLINEAEFTRATQRNPHPVKEAKIDTPPPDVPNPEPTPPVPDPTPPTPSPPPPSAHSEPPPPVPQPEVKPPEPTPPQPPPPAPSPEPKPAPPPPPPPKPQPKPEPPKELAKPTPPKPPDKSHEDQQFDTLLKNLTHQPAVAQHTNAPPKLQKQKPAAQAASAQPDAPLGAQLSTSERDMLVQQIEHCWNYDPGAKGADDLKVEIHIELDETGTITSSQIVDRARLTSDPVWRAAAESAYRATLAPDCHTLKLPPDKYQTWKSINLIFDPKDLQ